MPTPVILGSTVTWAVIMAVAITASFEVRDSQGFNGLVAVISSAIWAPTILGVGARTAWPDVAFALLVLILLFEVFVVSVFMIGKGMR